MLNISLLQITPFGYGTLCLMAFSVWLTMRFFKRKEEDKPGCLLFGYAFLVIFLLGSFALMISYFTLSTAFKKADFLLHAKKYSARVVDFKTTESYDDESGTTTNYYTVLEFTTDNWQTITRTSDESETAHKHQVGETRRVYYDATNDKIQTVGAGTYIMLIGMLLMSLVFGGAFVFIVMYCVGMPMEKFQRFLINFGTMFLVPLIMIAFDALLIYALMYGNTEQSPLVIVPLLLFFILVLTLAIFGYIKMIIKKGAPKFRRVSATRWVGDWDD